MTLLPHATARGTNTCSPRSHAWVTRRYDVRHGAREMRMCSTCNRNEVVLPGDRPRQHYPAHANLRATAA